MDKICYDCLNKVTVIIYDKGFYVCRACYHRRYSRRRHEKFIFKEEKTYTLKDLKDHLEKNW